MCACRQRLYQVSVLGAGGWGLGSLPSKANRRDKGCSTDRSHACVNTLVCTHTHTFTHLPSQPRILTFTRTFFFFF